MPPRLYITSKNQQLYNGYKRTKRRRIRRKGELQLNAGHILLTDDDCGPVFDPAASVPDGISEAGLRTGKITIESFA